MSVSGIAFMREMLLKEVGYVQFEDSVMRHCYEDDLNRALGEIVEGGRSEG